MAIQTETEVNENKPTTAKWMDSIKNIQVANPPEPSPAAAQPQAQPAAAPAEPVKPTEAAPVKPEPPAEPEADKMPRTSADWKKFREARDAKEKEYQAKLKEYEAQVKELAAKPSAPADYEQTKKQVDEYSTIIQQISVENHPKFKAYYDGAINSQVELAKQIVGTDLAAQATEILTMPEGGAKNEKIDELFGNLTPSQQARLGGVVNALANIQNERAGEIRKSRDTYAAIQKQKEVEQQQRVKTFEQTFDSTIKTLQSESPAYQTREGDDAWNAEVTERINAAKNLVFGNAKPEQLMRAAADAVALPAILKQNLGLLEKVATLEKQVQELSSASPRVNGDRQPEGGAGAAPAPAKAPVGSRPMDAMAATWMKGLPQLGR